MWDFIEISRDMFLKTAHRRIMVASNLYLIGIYIHNSILDDNCTSCSC